VLNALRQNGNEQPIVSVRDKNLLIRLPSLTGNAYLARINWLQRIESGKPYFLAGLTYLEGPAQDGSTEWVLKTHPTEGFVPMFCSLYWKEVY
jgi:hypothetical protein